MKAFRECIIQCIENILFKYRSELKYVCIETSLRKCFSFQTKKKRIEQIRHSVLAMKPIGVKMASVNAIK